MSENNSEPESHSDSDSDQSDSDEFYERVFLQHCHDNNLEGVDDCLPVGIDVDIVSEDGKWSGLTIAAEKNYLELLEMLLSNDVEINNTVRKYGYERTALMVACSAGNSAIVSRLIQEPDLDINYEDRRGYTALLLADESGHTDCVRILAETGRVDWNKREILAILLRYPGVDLSCRDKRGWSLVFRAIRINERGEKI